MKRTNILLDEALVRREKQTGLLTLKGKVRWTGSLEAMRRTRLA